MASIFGAPWNSDVLGQGVVQGSPGPMGPGPGGGFPGIFPTAGPGNSGFAGFGQGTFGKVGPCTAEDVKNGACVLGPSSQFLGKR